MVSQSPVTGQGPAADPYNALKLLRVNGHGTTTLANSSTYDTSGRPTTTAHNGIANLGFRYLYVGQFDVQRDDEFGAC